MTEQELIEQLADKEHESWANWQKYLHSLCDRREDGSLVIPAARIRHWEKEIATPYAELPDHVKQFDRDEVKHILPIIEQYVNAAYDSWQEHVNDIEV